jgi:hypothetical protein
MLRHPHPEVSPGTTLVDKEQCFVILIRKFRLEPEEVGYVAARDIPLLAIEDVVIAVPNSSSFQPRDVRARAGLGYGVTVLTFAAHHRQDVALELLIAAGFEHPLLRFRKTPGKRILPDCNLFDHRQAETAVCDRRVKTGEAEFDRTFLVSFCDIGR